VLPFAGFVSEYEQKVFGEIFIWSARSEIYEKFEAQFKPLLECRR